MLLSPSAWLLVFERWLKLRLFRGMDLYYSCSRPRLKLSPCDRLVWQPRAQILLRTVPVPLQAFKWLIIPMLNPDGVARGSYRCSWGLSVQAPHKHMQQTGLQQVWLVQILTVTAMQHRVFSVLVGGALLFCCKDNDCSPQVSKPLLRLVSRST